MWFQNRRSKSRKEGTTEQNRRKYEPYPIKEKPGIYDQKNESKVNLREGEERSRMTNPPQSTPLFHSQPKPCECAECVAASMKDPRVAREILPPMREACNCGECISKIVARNVSASRSIQERVDQHGSLDQFHYRLQSEPRRQQRPCNCQDCLRELQKTVRNREGARQYSSQSTEKIDLAITARRVQPRNDAVTMEGRNTLHYLAYQNPIQKCDCYQCQRNGSSRY